MCNCLFGLAKNLKPATIYGVYVVVKQLHLREENTKDAYQPLNDPVGRDLITSIDKRFSRRNIIILGDESIAKRPSPITSD